MIYRLSMVLSVVLLFAACASTVEETEPLYFGMEPPGAGAALFAPGIVSVEGRYEYALSVSPDGREILFTTEAPGTAAALYHSRLQEEGWSAPEKVSLSGGAKRAEMEAFYTPDGKSIHFAPYDEGMDVRIWTVDRTPEGWSSPRQLGSPLADDPAFFPTTTLGGEIYYTNLAARKVYRAKMAGDTVESVEDTGLAISGHPFIAPDGSYVLVDGRKTEGGTSDIYVAFREEDGGWGAPIDLGPQVNTNYDETCPTMSHDGKFIFFSRYDEENEVSNIYWINSDVIAEQRARAFLLE
jgi:Tol biopolymer transport system component